MHFANLPFGLLPESTISILDVAMLPLHRQTKRDIYGATCLLLPCESTHCLAFWLLFVGQLQLQAGTLTLLRAPLLLCSSVTCTVCPIDVLTRRDWARGSLTLPSLLLALVLGWGCL